MTDLSEMRRVAEAATPGPWELDPRAGPSAVRLPAEKVVLGTWSPENAAHVATFDPPTVLALLDVARNAEWALELFDGKSTGDMAERMGHVRESLAALSRLESL